MLAPGGITLVDPAMADHGKLYSGLTEEYAGAMMALCAKADIMIPNITEAAMITGLPYRDNLEKLYVHRLMEKLPGKDVLLTGVGFADGDTGFAMRSKGTVSFYHHTKVGKSYHGTGDIFASAFCGSLACGKRMEEAGQIAADFTLRCIQKTFEAPAHWYGVRFESVLPELINLLK